MERIQRLSPGKQRRLYGRASHGGNLAGSGSALEIGGGTVFKISPDGQNFSLVYTFCSWTDCADGAVPFDALTQGTGKDHPGTTWGGGSRPDGGTIFRVTPEWELAKVYTFCYDYPFCSDGGNPLAVVLGRDGNFYGATYSGASNRGTVFEITAEGKLTTISSFCAQVGCTDGSGLRKGMTLGSEGNFYGTTYYGGTLDKGTVFKITPEGELTTLHSFDGTSGNHSIGGSVQTTNGAFYGTTSSGGSDNDGTIFSLAVGLHPFVETVPASGEVGTNVIILGNNLTGTTDVSFNGTPAHFTVVSSSEIIATVPPRLQAPSW